MTKTLKTLALASALIAGASGASSVALAGFDAGYHWGYPDALKLSQTVPHVPGGGSGIPAQYR